MIPHLVANGMFCPLKGNIRMVNQIVTFVEDALKIWMLGYRKVTTSENFLEALFEHARTKRDDSDAYVFARSIFMNLDVLRRGFF